MDIYDIIFALSIGFTIGAMLLWGASILFNLSNIYKFVSMVVLTQFCIVYMIIQNIYGIEDAVSIPVIIIIEFFVVLFTIAFFRTCKRYGWKNE